MSSVTGNINVRIASGYNRQVMMKIMIGNKRICRI
jgi:hypothetical protein